jgi:hypothetical protein
MSKVVTCALVWLSDAESAEAVGRELHSSLRRMGFAEQEFEIMVSPAGRDTDASGEPAYAATGRRILEACNGKP